MSEDLKKLTEAVQSLVDRHDVHTEQHADHHRFIQAQIEKAEAKAEFWKTIKTRVVATGILGALVFVCHSVWQEFLSKVNGS